MRIDARQTRLFARELGIREMPVFSLRNTAAAVSTFERVFMLLTERPLAIDAALHAAVTSLISLLFEARQLGDVTGLSSANPDLALHRVLASMRVNHRHHWSVSALAQISGLSVPHFFRRFRKATGSSPMDWLRRERMNHAKRRLTESRDRIREIAEQVGYGDPLYFSRDFKKLVGMSPKHYREREQAAVTIKSR
jgi:AraC-like DNA-binding protein